VRALDFTRRATEPELLDLGVSEAETLENLADLGFVNRRLGSRRDLLRAVRPFLDGRGGRLLDVGSGSGDLPGFLRGSLRGELLAVAADLKPLHVRQAPPGVAAVAADVRALPFAPGSFDVVTANLFLHHFDGPEVAAVLRALYALARRALIVHDLRRARAPYLFGRAFFPLLFRSRVSVADGLLSIRRAFTPAELAAAFADAGIPRVRIRRAFPYRLLAVAAKEG